ncbi:hypothetical protein [Gimibacter soli]|uniref:Uncharacterized protein n=1 Tax=Gimibacter soli TaxID=3024400 RepID=A0AAF0BME1_9PROT|nr:hypothetical protein [Gimibacter soli]WCL54435.1 hypothetical protein PH603_01515 [Gimibacter soli]
MSEGYGMIGSWRRVALAVALCLPAVMIAPLPVWAAEKAEEAPQPYIDLAPIYLSVLNKGRVIGVVTLELVLEVKDPAHDSAQITERLRQIEGDFAAAGMEMARQVFRVDRPIDPDLVVAYLTPYAERRLGPDKVNVLVKQALIRPM